MVIDKTCRAHSSAKSVSRWVTGLSNVPGRKSTCTDQVGHRLLKTLNYKQRKSLKQVQILDLFTMEIINDQRLILKENAMANSLPRLHPTPATVKVKTCKLNWKSYLTNTKRCRIRRFRLRVKTRNSHPALLDPTRAAVLQANLAPTHLLRQSLLGVGENLPHPPQS